MSRSFILTCTLIFLIANCAAPRPASYVSTRLVDPLLVAEGGDRVWSAAQDVLRASRFRLDRVDRRAGVITTMPVTSQSILEFWRHDVATREDLWESTINPLRRWVEIAVRRGSDGRWEELAVVVHKERLSAPDRQFNTTGAAYQYFGDRLPSTTGAAEVSVADDRWLDRGRDPAMEAYLLQAILARAAGEAER